MHDNNWSKGPNWCMPHGFWFSQNVWYLHKIFRRIIEIHTRKITWLKSYCSVTQLCLTLWPHGLQHARLPYPSPFPRAYSNSCPLSWWCYSTISSSVVSFSCLQSFPASGSFLTSQLFTSGGQSIGGSASESVLPMNSQGWFPLYYSWGSQGKDAKVVPKNKGLSRVFSNTTVQKHQFFGAQPSLWSNSHNCTWLLEKP